MENMTNNQVMIAGTIDSGFTFSHETFGEKFYTVYLLVERLSGASDKVHLTVSEVLIDVTQDHKGKGIIVHGQYRSYNQHDNGKNHLILSAFAQELDFIEAENVQVSMNDIFLDGYICKPPTYRKTPLGREVADIMIAVNRPYGKSDYIPCICWGRNARYVCKLPVGAHLQLSGRIQSREYTKMLETGPVIRTAYEVSVSKIKELK